MRVLVIGAGAYVTGRGTGGPGDGKICRPSPRPRGRCRWTR